MSNKMRRHRDQRTKPYAKAAAKLAHDLQREDDLTRMSNRKGRGLLPSQLGWGQHRSRKSRVSLFDPFKGG